jgi:hypothetical protein
MEVNAKQHERPEKQGQDKIEKSTDTGDCVSETEGHHHTDDQIDESAERDATPFDDVHDCSSEVQGNG